MAASVPNVLSDVRYAMRQLRRFNDQTRALDALERVEEALHVHDLARRLDALHIRLAPRRAYLQRLRASR